MLTLYNTLTKKKEPFKSITSGKVGLYVCGPTVYNYAHIGNIKAYITSDLLRRHLEHIGFEVRMIKNITDVGHLTRDELSQGDTGEDKIELQAKKEHRSPEEIALFYETYFKDAEREMNILPAHYFPRASAHISHMIALIQKLLKNGYAYESNGNVFYDISQFSHYGELSGNTVDNLKTGARIEEEHPDKRNQWDFALWLKAPKDHMMQWDSPWSRGYPGWHIECSAMSMEYLGEQFDIHTGGEDHIFPHHEAEIAQSEGVTHKHPWVRFWIHTRHILVDGKKMSKSKGNFYTIEDIKKRGYSPMHLRLALLSAHYRSQMNFTWDALDQAKKNFERIANWILLLKSEQYTTNKTEIQNEFEKNFWDALDDDLNTPRALSILYELITYTNGRKNELSPNAPLAIWNRMNTVLGLTFPISTENTIPKEVQTLIAERDIARTNKDFFLSDSLRAKIEMLGYTVKDGAEGTTIKKSVIKPPFRLI